jgi:hypothetical protein
MKDKNWTCSTCNWWWNREPRCSQCAPLDVMEGECRRFPPTTSAAGFGIWPTTGCSDGCGEWKSEDDDGR